MKLRLVSFALVASFGLATLAFERPAHAYYEAYCGVLVNADTWCWGPYRDRIIWNRAQYPGSGTVSVGIKLYFNTFGTYHDRHFANNYVASAHSTGIPGQAGAANGSNNRHTINGRMEVCPGCVPAIVGPSAEDGGAIAGDGFEGIDALRRAARPDDRLATSILHEIQDAGYLVHAGSARLARQDQVGASYFLVPGSHLCLVREEASGQSAAGTCSTAEQVARGEAILVSDLVPDLAPGLVRITGIAPDGTSSVRIQLVAGGPIVEVPVESNLFVAELPGTAERGPESVVFLPHADPADDLDADANADAGMDGGCSTGGAGGAGSGLMLLALAGLLSRRGRRRASA